MQALGFHHVAILARDVARLAAFYRNTFKLPELRRFLHADGSLRSVWVAASSVQTQAELGFLAIEAAPDSVAPGALGFTMVALRIEATQRAQIEAELTSAGVAIERRTDWTLYLRDPEGNLIGLSHYPHPVP